MRSTPRGCKCRCGPFSINMIPHGLLKPYILRLLSDGPMHGFEMMEEVFERTGGMWRPGPSAIYPTLERLEEEGYVESLRRGEGEKARRPYQITKKGSEALNDYDKFREEWIEGLSRLKEIWW